MKRLAIAAAFVAACATGFAQYESIEALVEKSANEPALQFAQWGVYAEYAKTGEPIVEYNEHFALAPASGLKTLTSAAALHYLGSEFRYTTRLYYEGEIGEDGTLQGDLHIVGEGDPTLGTAEAKVNNVPVEGAATLAEIGDEWVGAVKRAGIKRVAGAAVADDLAFDRIPIPLDWSWIDLGNYYGACQSALSIHDNLYFLYLKPGENVGDPTEVLRVEPPVPGLEFENHITTGPKGSGDNGYIYRAPGQYTATLRGTIPAGVEEFAIKGSLPEPALSAARYLERRLNEAGVAIAEPARLIDEPIDRDPATMLHEHESPPLKDVAAIVNKRSNNHYTEQLLKTIAWSVSGKGTTDNGVALLVDFLEENGVNADGLRLSDGCGLSRFDAITPTIMARALSSHVNRPYFDDFYNSLSVAGDPNDVGYFKTFGVGTIIEKNARIKSGLIGNVRSHSGYVWDQNGALISFSFIANNHSSYRDVNQIHKELIIALAKLK
ncbi:MAG: D-alanyl-D-alanine carboxypeptidase/D-alanyl-D-alanine-endopeptidase [Ignavibacteriales bacterium]|nr:D-alanyl-D-alanine carboxypeptidase/D-alanyl-D-alanine-endopeptidase [Ignavibacteriales bacterium]